jgi:plasmid stabilization system protein ParE
MITAEFHPEVRRDLEDIWEHIGADNPDAADRVITEIVDAIDAVVPFRGRGSPTPKSHFKAFALSPRPRISGCLCARGKAAVGCGRDARTAQSARDGRDSQRQRLGLSYATNRPRRGPLLQWNRRSCLCGSLQGSVSPHIGNALWLVSALPVWYLSPISNPLAAGILSLIPFAGSLALVGGAIVGILQRRPSLLLFGVSPFISECYVAIAGALRGELPGDLGMVPASIFAVVQAAFLIWFLKYRLKEGRLAVFALSFFCVSYAFFALFVGAMAFADSWL